MNSAMQAAVDELEAWHPALRVQQAGGACPFQASGTLHGQPFYFRFRHNWAELRIGAEHFKPLYVAGQDYGDDEDQGWIDPEDLPHLMARLIRDLERAPIYWEFPGVATDGDISMRDPGSPATYGCWADSPLEAWELLHRPSPWLCERGIDEQTQAQWVQARQMSPRTITVDDRVFPDPDPFARPA